MTGNNYKYNLTSSREVTNAMFRRRKRALENPKEDPLFKLIFLADKKER